MAPADYQLIKGGFALLSLAFCWTLQGIRPWHRRRQDLRRNWRINIPLGLLNALLLGSLSGAALLAACTFAAEHPFGLSFQWGLSLPARLALSVVALDLATYLWHIANHRVAWLWRWHAVHHTDTVFDTSTAFRFHPGEVLLSLGVRGTIILVCGLPVEGLLLFEIAFTFCNAFEHTNARLPRGLERAIDKAFITPALHRAHHSVERSAQNSNFGTIFAVWDILLRTRTHATSEDPITVGLAQDALAPMSLAALLTMPFHDVPASRRDP